MISGAALAFGCQNESNSSAPTGSTPAVNSPTSNTPSGNTSQSTAKLDDAAKTKIVLSELHAANQQEINEGKLAADRAQNPDIKKFANDMVSDHTSADQKLTDLAKRLNIDLTSTPDNPVQAAKADTGDADKRMLSGLSGAAFDVAYLAPQVQQHEMALQLINQGDKVASGDTKRFLEEIKPTVEAHREHAKNLMKGLKFDMTAVGGGPAGGSGSSMEGKDGRGTSGATNPSMGTSGTGSSTSGRHDSSTKSTTGTERSGKGAGTGIDTSPNKGSGTSGTHGGGTTRDTTRETTTPSNP
jgi:putative membrane protein